MTCFTANDIFDIAESIERSASEFYRETSERISDEATRKVLLDVASMEDGHLKIFQRMHQEFHHEEGVLIYELDDRSATYLQTMADARGWEGRKSPLKELSGQETPREIMEIALNAENESVAFYCGLKNLIAIQTDREIVEKIILEELGHISVFLQRLRSIE